MPVRTSIRVVRPIWAISILLLVLGMSTAWYVSRLELRMSSMLNLNVSSLRAAEELELAVREMRHELNLLQITQESVHFDGIRSNREEADRWFRQVTQLATMPEEMVAVQKIRTGLDEFDRQLRALEEAWPDRLSGELFAALDERILTEQVIAHCHRYLDHNEQALERHSRENTKLARRLSLAFVLLGTCGAVAGLLAGYGLAHKVNRSLALLNVPIRDAAGKLNEVAGPIEITSEPDLEEMRVVMQEVASDVGAVVEELHKCNRDAIRADQMVALGQLAAGLAHELRNPLMCVKVLIQTARRNPDESLDVADLEILDEEICRLESLLQGFLDFARPATLEKQHMDLVAVVRQTVNFLTARAQRQDIEINLLSSEKQIFVEGDETQLRQVLLNLVLNAFDAIRSDGMVSITLEVVGDPDVEEDGAGYVVLRVVDTGCGLSETDQERLFEPFYSTKQTGLGLGLAVTRRIVKSHGGSIHAGNRQGGGAVFEFRIPLAASCEQNAESEISVGTLTGAEE